MFKAVKQPPKNAVKIDFVKMKKQHYPQCPNKTKQKQNILLFTPSIKACTLVHHKIISTPEQFKQIQETALIILEITQHDRKFIKRVIFNCIFFN